MLGFKSDKFDEEYSTIMGTNDFFSKKKTSRKNFGNITTFTIVSFFLTNHSSYNS